MCRMLGIYGKVDDWKRVVMSFSQQAENGKVPPKKGILPGHKDGWGMAISGSNGKEMVLLKHQLGSAADSPLFKQVLDTVEKPPAIFTCHLRKASPGIAVTPNNIHPFFTDGWSFIHNGTIYESEALPRDKNLSPTSDGSDSEHYFHYLMSKIGDRPGHETARSLAEAISQIDVDYTSLTSILSNGREMFVIRKHKIHPDYYTLYAYRFPNGIVICSEPVQVNGLDAANWKLMEENSILKIHGDPIRIEKYQI